MIDQLPPELAELIAAEKATPVITDATRKLLRARIAATVGKAPLGHAVAGTALATGKALAIVAVVVGATVTGVVTSRHAPAPAPPITATTPPPTPPPAIAPEPHVEAAPPVPPARIARPRAKPPSEIELIQQAWAALSAGDPTHALELAREDARLHADGVLAEERDALQVIALARLHRRDAADAGTRFFDRYPDTVHRALVLRALEENP